VEAVRALGRFVAGAFVEVCQLMLVAAGALFGVPLARDRGVPVSDSLVFLGFFAFYSLFVLLPARDLIEGWLGMIAGRQPARFGNRAENLGRATLMIAAAVGFCLVPTTNETDSPETRAFTFAFLVLALVVFVIGGAVPRLWFAVKHVDSDVPDVVPDMLRETGRRGSLLVYCAFMGMGLAIAVATAVAYACETAR
jgi:hypothetical protein